MKLISKFMLLFSLKITFAISHEEKLKITVDLVKSYDERPVRVTAFLCFDKNLKLKLIKQLATLKSPTPIRFINDPSKISKGLPADTFAIADLNCPGIEDLLTEANKTNKFNNPYRWLLLGHLSNKSMIPPLLEALNIQFDSEVLITQETTKGYFEIHLIYKIRLKQLWLTEYYGFWTSSSGLQKSEQIKVKTKLLRRRNLAREELFVTFNVDDMTTGPCLADCDIKVEKSAHSINHWGYQQILPLYQFLNATRLYFFADNWGYFEHGTWNGVVGTMIRGHADLSGTPIFFNKDRLPHVLYLSDAIQTSARFVFREPPLSYQNNLFLLPFNKAVWWSLAGFVMIMMIVIYVNAKWEVKKSDILGEQNKNIKGQDFELTIISDVAMMIVGAISQQGSFVELRGSIGRLVMFTLFLAFLFLFTAYSASIVALLQSSSKQIRTLSDLLNSRLELGVENTTYNIHYFTTATDPVRKAIYETKVAPKGSKSNFMSLEEGVRKLQKHPFAFNMDTGLGYRTVEKFFYEHEKCGLQEISYIIPTSKPWLTCRKDSPYAELLKIAMFRIREHGMSDRANRLVYSRKPVCSRSGGSFDSVSIVDVYPSLLMLLYGILLACALLAVEVLFYRQMNKATTDSSTGNLYKQQVTAEQVLKVIFRGDDMAVKGQLRCYACSFSSVDSDRSCLTITNTSRTVECPYTYCTILRQEFIDPAGTVASFMRGCDDKPDHLNHEVTDVDFRTFYRACTSDLCNIGDGIQSVVGGNLNPNPINDGENLLVPGTGGR